MISLITIIIDWLTKKRVKPKKDPSGDYYAKDEYQMERDYYYDDRE